MYMITKKVGQDKNAQPRGRWPHGKPFPEHINLPLAEGTLERIEKQLAPKESRVDFIRAAIDDKLTRRARRKD